MDTNTKTRTFASRMAENARKATKYGGKRFLGFTPSGAEVWISLLIDRETKTVELKTTHDIDVLLEEGAVLASRRVTVKRNATNHSTAEDLLRRMQKNMGGDITEDTITYFKKLLHLVESKTLGYENNVPTTGLIRLVTNAVYEGDVDDESVGFRWTEVIKYWGFPRGEYFTLERVNLV